MEVSALQRRVDRKYLVRSEVLAGLLEELASGLRVLEISGRRESQYETVYFETPDLGSYLGAARGRRRRFKVRTRHYVEDGRCLLEVKVRSGRGETVKHALPYAAQDRRRLTGEALAFVVEHVDLPLGGRELRAVLTTSYRRTTLVQGENRVTVDSGFEASRVDGARLGLSDEVIVESKTLGRAAGFDRRLWAEGIRPLSLSKYAVAMAGLDTSLPANRWNRVLRRSFDWEPVRSLDRVGPRHWDDPVPVI